MTGNAGHQRHREDPRRVPQGARVVPAVEPLLDLRIAHRILGGAAGGFDHCAARSATESVILSL